MAAFVLASGSPRRRDVLSLLGVSFEVAVPDVDEARHRDEPPETYVTRVAAAKAAAVPSGRDRWIVAADTTVVLDGAVLGKPVDPEDATAMLATISGRTHRVLTGLALAKGDESWVRLEEARVTMRSLSAADIDWYVGTGEPLDKAGSYAVQGLGAVFVEHIEGSFYNVMGLPIEALAEMLEQRGLPPSEWVGAS